MRKKVFGKKLSRDFGSRRALLRSLARNVVLHDKIKTTKAKAQAVLPLLEKLGKVASEDTLTARRRALKITGNDEQVVKALFLRKDLFAKRKSGFTRITYLPQRRGDNANLATIEWVDKIPEKEEKPKKKK